MYCNNLQQIYKILKVCVQSFIKNILKEIISRTVSEWQTKKNIDM